MKKLFLALLLATVAFGADSQEAVELDSLPSRIVVLSGDGSHPSHVGNVSQMYSRTNLAFEDPAAPRFLFLDKKGQVALGIGGYLKAVGMYDFDGTVDDNDYITNLIPVPNDPGQRQRFGATAANSTIFLKLVTCPTKVGRVIVYIQTNFTGDNGGYGLKLKQAYVSVGHVTLGKARSTFADGPAMAPTVDDQGPAGQVSAKNMLVQYIPLYLQYAWNKGDSHVRLSGILRELSYRDLVAGKNHFVTGWGVQLSAVADIVGGLSFFGHYTYGKGIGYYINDLSGEDYDLVPRQGSPGELKAPGAAGWTAGLQYTFSDNFFVSASYSRAQLYDTAGMDATTYRYGQYIAANAFYNVWGDLRVGVEYLHGTRKDISGLSGKSNRVEAALQYSF